MFNRVMDVDERRTRVLAAEMQCFFSGYLQGDYWTTVELFLRSASGITDFRSPE